MTNLRIELEKDSAAMKAIPVPPQVTSDIKTLRDLGDNNSQNHKLLKGKIADQKSDVLRRIGDIEAKIKKLEKDVTYLKLPWIIRVAMKIKAFFNNFLK